MYFKVQVVLLIQISQVQKYIIINIRNKIR